MLSHSSRRIIRVGNGIALFLRRARGQSSSPSSAAEAAAPLSVKDTSTTPMKLPLSHVEPILIYEGIFAGKLRWLRRVSLLSSVVSMFGFPLVYFYGATTSSIPVIGQFMIVGTALFTSMSSTLFLQAITHPYVFQLHELRDETIDDKEKRRKFLASRLNVFGNSTFCEFEISEAEKIAASVHPFATFKVKDKLHYVFNVKDEALNKRLGV